MGEPAAVDGEGEDEPEPIYDPDEVTAAWLTEVLAHAGVLGGARVIGFDHEAIGTGQVGANIRYRLRYDNPHTAAPASVVGKFASRDEASRNAGVTTRTYETEVAFYRDLAATVDVSRPVCFYAAIEPGTADVVLLLEDMAPAEPGDQIAGCGPAQAELAVDEAARLHGPRWDDPTLLEHGWLAEGLAAAPGFADIYAYAWDPFIERYGERLEPAALEVGRELRDKIHSWSQPPPVLTLIHGDYRLDNMLFGPRMVPASRPLTVVDWQTVRLGCGTLDVAYFLGAGLDTTTRRAHEHALVARYHRALLAYGVPDYPFEACWEDYRRYSFSGYFMAVIASILVGRTERGDDMFMAMANRHATQITDLAAVELL
jgi:hypothetical protein